VSERLHVEIDRDVCVGSGSCEALDPAIFRVGEDGVAVLLDPNGDETTLRKAASLCPSGAIRLLNDGV
jgi:ferredoxin